MLFQLQSKLTFICSVCAPTCTSTCMPASMHLRACALYSVTVTSPGFYKQFPLSLPDRNQLQINWFWRPGHRCLSVLITYLWQVMARYAQVSILAKHYQQHTPFQYNSCCVFERRLELHPLPFHTVPAPDNMHWEALHYLNLSTFKKKAMRLFADWQ